MNMAWAVAGLSEMAPWLVRFTVAGAIVAAVAHILAFTLLRETAVTRVAAWRTTAVALVLIPLLAIVLPGKWRLPGGLAVVGVDDAPSLVLMSRDPVASGIESPAPVQVDIVPGFRDVLPLMDVLATAAYARVQAHSEGAPVEGAARGERRRGSPLRGLTLLWMAVTGWLLLQLVAGLFALHMHARRAKDVTSDVLHLLPLAVLSRGHLKVLRGGPFRVPVCWGVFRPTILLPRGSGGWTPERTRLVLLHESAHVERRDGLFLIITRVACALHWLNPLAWSLMRRLSADAEAACDAAVLRAGVPARHYARVLVDVAAEARRSRRPEFALALALLRTGSLTWRVTRILDPRVLTPARRGVTAAAAVLLALVALAGATVTLEAAPAPGRSVESPAREESVETSRASGESGPALVAEPQADPVTVVTETPATLELPALTLDRASVPSALQLISEVPLDLARNAATVVDRLDRPVVQAPVPELPIARPAVPARATRIRGVLLEHGTDRPVAQGTIWIVNTAGVRVAGGFSDPSGNFSIEVPAAGEYYVNASALGYRETIDGTVAVEEGDEISFKFRIAPAPLPVAGLLVERDAGLMSTGFYQRMNAGIGHFITPDDLQASRGLQLTDLLESVARVDVVRDGSAKQVRMSNSTGYCTPRVFVDAMLISSEGNDLDSVAPLGSVDAIEVYSSATQIPIQWAGGRRACGAIVIWTK